MAQTAFRKGAKKCIKAESEPYNVQQERKGEYQLRTARNENTDQESEQLKMTGNTWDTRSGKECGRSPSEKDGSTGLKSRVGIEKRMRKAKGK